MYARTLQGKIFCPIRPASAVRPVARYSSRRLYLLTERERALYQRLVQSFPKHIVLVQVQLLQVLNFRPGCRSAGVFNRCECNQKMS